ncbi:PaaI family thioesterase [Gordonia sp. ABSL49_1]|uniref:PaaI family thioesterase n=1 Tax=unclassified Gordonia (in: high G+C Gram-positive bacteria) TaxID=2657482 RepID=UPI001F106E0E|nr:PaaI family thioesterase [Gordonia sp. ABSL49_1]MCH5645270.1 PaaI family thioesterase [Gordonia sp. ABSL49_1]
MNTPFVVPADLEPLERHPKAVSPGESIGRHNPACFGCGPDSPRGLHLDVRAGEGFTASASMHVEPWMEGGPGIMHGGLVSSAFDEVMVKVPMLVDPATVTAHLEVNFRAPIPVGSTLTVEATLLGRQRRKVYAEGIAHLGDPDRPVAYGKAMFVAINAREHFADHVHKSQMDDDLKDRMSRP